MLLPQLHENSSEAPRKLHGLFLVLHTPHQYTSLVTNKGDQTMSEEQRKLSELQLNDESAPLSPHRAFVIQFRSGTTAESGKFAGRVEHVVSGRATRFCSLAELLTFLGQELTAVEEKPP
jgi:hypothetical protein